MLAATLRHAGASRRLKAFSSWSRVHSASFRISAAGRRVAGALPLSMAPAASASAAAATLTPTSTTPKRRFPPLAPGSVAPEEYSVRLEERIERVRLILSNVLPRSNRQGEGEGEEAEQQPPPFPLEVFASPDQGFRLRAEFRVWHDGGDLYYVMFDTVSRFGFNEENSEFGGVGEREEEKEERPLLLTRDKKSAIKKNKKNISATLR